MRVEVVTDSGASIRPEDKEAREYSVTIVPLNITFFEDGQPKSYDDLEFTPREFYRKMRESKELPQTSGAVIGKIAKIYQELSGKTDSIISIHVTSKHSVAWESAVQGAEMAQAKIPELSIEVIDSKQISLGTWFLAKLATKLSQEGASLEEIKNEVLITVPKIQLYAALSTLDNIIKGGRVPTLTGYLGKALKILPVLGVFDGEIKEISKVRTVGRARREMIKMVEGEEKEIARMVVLHTNDPEAAKEVREALAEFYKGKIPIYEAGPVLGVHAGEGAVGVAFQRA